MIGSRLTYTHVIEKLFNANFAFKRCEYVSICIFNQEMTLIQLLLWVNPIQAGLFLGPGGGAGADLAPNSPTLNSKNIEADDDKTWRADCTSKNVSFEVRNISW